MFFLRCLLALIPSLGLAQSANPQVPDPASGLMQMLVGLALVLACIIGGLYLLKRLSGPRGAASGLLRVVSATAVGPRERVVTVEIGDTWLVVGVAPGQVRQLHTMARVEERQAAPDAPPGGDFGSWLRKVTERRNDAR